MKTLLPPPFLPAAQSVSAALSAHYFPAIVQRDAFADFVFESVQKDRQLPFARKDAKGRLAYSLAHGRCRERMNEALFFLGRYEMLNAETPKHRSATCVVLFARDHGEQLFFARHRSRRRWREQRRRDHRQRGGRVRPQVHAQPRPVGAGADSSRRRARAGVVRQRRGRLPRRRHGDAAGSTPILRAPARSSYRRTQAPEYESHRRRRAPRGEV